MEIHDWYGPDDPEKPFNFSTNYKLVSLYHGRELESVS
jgi:hypothetical protein